MSSATWGNAVLSRNAKIGVYECGAKRTYSGTSSVGPAPIALNSIFHQKNPQRRLTMRAVALGDNPVTLAIAAIF